MRKHKPHSTLLLLKPVAPPLTKAELADMSFDPNQYSERLAENTVAAIDQDMETFNFSTNEFYLNSIWAEKIQHTAECAGYDADYEMASLAGAHAQPPRHSPDNAKQVDSSGMDIPKT